MCGNERTNEKKTGMIKSIGVFIRTFIGFGIELNAYCTCGKSMRSISVNRMNTASVYFSGLVAHRKTDE